MLKFYWERQDAKNHTCGLHVLNCILQNPIYDQSKLKYYAEVLRAQQKQLSEDLDEVMATKKIIDVDGCSIELLGICLNQHKIHIEHINFKENYELR